MSDEEKVAASAARKDKGNGRFRAGKWAAALKQYQVGSTKFGTSIPGFNNVWILAGVAS